MQIWNDVNEHEVIQCWEQKKIVFLRGKILEILYLRKRYNYDYKKMLGLVICYFNNNQLFFQVFSLSKLMFFTEE